jgi:hypothetical protein
MQGCPEPSFLLCRPGSSLLFGVCWLCSRSSVRTAWCAAVCVWRLLFMVPLVG